MGRDGIGRPSGNYKLIFKKLSGGINYLRGKEAWQFKDSENK